MKDLNIQVAYIVGSFCDVGLSFFDLFVVGILDSCSDCDALFRNVGLWCFHVRGLGSYLCSLPPILTPQKAIVYESMGHRAKSNSPFRDQLAFPSSDRTTTFFSGERRDGGNQIAQLGFLYSLGVWN